MDILKNSTPKESGTQQTRPIFLVILLVLLIIFAVYWYTKNNSTLLSPIVNSATSSTVVAPIKIDYDFLKSPELQALEKFPDYADFKPATGTEVQPFRANPFLPPFGTTVKQPAAK